MKTMLCAVAAVMLLANSATAGDWRLSSGDEDHVRGIDFSSVVSEGNIRTFWEIAVYKVTNDLGADYLLSRTQVNCATQQVRDMAFQSYTMDGKRQFNSSSPTSWDMIYPDTVASGVMETVCGRKTPQELGIETHYDFARISRSVLQNEN